MGLEPEFLEMASTTVTVNALSTHNNAGAPVYSTDSATYPACVEYRPRLLVNREGRQVVAVATVYVLSSSASIGVQDRVVLPYATAARMLSAAPVNDEEGQHHVELVFGSAGASWDR